MNQWFDEIKQTFFEETSEILEPRLEKSINFNRDHVVKLMLIFW